jgi:Flp pilus assembly protein TadD
MREAVQCFQQAVAVEPAHALAWQHLGRALELVGDNAGALSSFEQALRLAPESVVLRRKMGELLFSRRRFAEAVAEIAILRNPNPNEPKGLRNNAGRHAKQRQISRRCVS